ncbi:MAG: hypothetical protein NZ737_02435 [Candidatus Poseidoniaceae archaeon]|jgi:hypothetical protein|nr:hypothetical protein [Candidatus Poseidoniaceae archaeon]
MPGSPYLAEPPEGLWTWPRLLKFSIPTIGAISVVAWWQELLMEWGIVLILAFGAALILRR